MSKLFSLVAVVFFFGEFNRCSKAECQTFAGLGRFESFLHNYFRILINNFSSKKLVSYCKQVHWTLIDQSEYSEMDRLADHVGELCDQDGGGLKSDLNLYQKEVLKTLPARLEFFKAINKAFTEMQTMQFNSYNDYLVETARYPHPDTWGKTKWLVKDVLVKNIRTYLTERQKYDLKKKLRRAVKEYESSAMKSDSDFNYLVNYFKTEKYPHLLM